jgi:hypothetical protein
MAKNKDRDPSEMILGTFRVRAGMWEQFKQLASYNNATATDLILSFIENCLQSQSIPQSNLDVIPQSNLDDIYTYIDEKISQSIQDINTPSIQNIEAMIDSRISGSISDGDIKSAIAQSYKAAMGQFNGLLEEVQLLKKQLEELQSIPSAPVPPSAIDNSPAPADNSPAPELEVPHNKQQIIRAALSKKNIKVSSAQIRQAFYDAGWVGNNFEAIRKDIEKLLGGK